MACFSRRGKKKAIVAVARASNATDLVRAQLQKAQAKAKTQL
jgi:hypothetical protein